jgi:biopolymer transport protein ExbD
MMCLRSVCLIAAAAIVSLAAQVSVRSQNSSQAAPPMQRGVSVEMASTNYAMPMPAADDRNAWIVTLTENGSIYFGVNAVTVETLAEDMQRHPRERGQMLYVKSDARARFADVERVLEAASEAGFDAPVLLTSQIKTMPQGAIVPPNGLEVWTGSSSSDGQSIGVRILAERDSLPILKINDEQVPWSALQTKLDQLLRNRRDKAILLEADEKLPYAEVVHVVDVCHSSGARVVFKTPTV